jgi:hypothetical protein
MIKKVLQNFRYFSALSVITLLVIGLSSNFVLAQSTDNETPNNELKSLRSDVGIHGLTANFHWLADFKYLGSDTLRNDGSSELEFVYRDVRMMSQRLGVGFQVVTSFFVNSDESDFGIGSWGVGPILRAYPFKSDQFQPYVQANVLLGNNLAVSELANTTSGNGFRMRLGLRGGFAYRLSNSWGIFTEVGYDWESGSFFKADSRALQANIGFDYYLFN